MLFSSLIFLFLFLPITIGLYLIAPKIGKNTVLLLASLLFYAWGGVSYLLVLIVSILLNHAIAIGINKGTDKKRKRWLASGVILNVLILATFKYLDFAIENVNGLLQLFQIRFELTEPGIKLPIGISFFTFQQMSMLWDVYRNEKREKLSLSDTALYVAFFPQLIAGPIVRYHDIIGQIRDRVPDAGLFRSGVQRFILGLFRKVVIANTCAELVDRIMSMNTVELNPALAWFGLSLFAIQLYFDFAGYSDMAIGLGRMFGFRILENFNFPYISKSVQEFWRRWHISLSNWFKDYVYIPLGGNRLGVSRTYVNLFAVFLLTGFWHGATWNFVLWGLIHGIFLVVERLGWKSVLDRLPGFVSWAYTIGVWVVSLAFFRIRNFSDSLDYLSAMFGMNESISDVSPFDLLNLEYGVVLAIALISSSKLLHYLKSWIQRQTAMMSESLQLLFEMAKASGLVAVFVFCIMLINAGSFDPFIYFRF